MDDFFADFLSNLTGGAVEAFQNETQRSAEFFTEFFQAVDWTQPWLIALMLFHAFCTIYIILSRRHASTLQIPLFAFFFILCAPASYINEWAAKNYRLFATDQYFDSAGMFITLVFCTPMMVNAVLILICMLIQIMGMFVKAKRAELMYKHRQQQAASTASTSKEQQDAKKTQ